MIRDLQKESHDYWHERVKAGDRPTQPECFLCDALMPNDHPAPFYAVLDIPCANGTYTAYYPICSTCVEAEQGIGGNLKWQHNHNRT